MIIIIIIIIIIMMMIIIIIITLKINKIITKVKNIKKINK
jgi:hypothetical protein